MFDFRFEPTISEIMREPMVRALMKADRVDARQFEARLRLMAGDAQGEAGEEEDGQDSVSLKRFLMTAPRAASERCCWA